MFPALLGAIAPAVIGGIFSSHANKKQNKSNQKQAVIQREVELEDDATRFTRLRDAAVAGGFNPLTALQFGGTTTGFGSGRVANQVFDWGPTASAAMSAAIPEISGQAGVARQREILEQDLLKVQTDALRVQSAATQAANAAQAFAPIGSNLGSSGASGGAGPAFVASNVSSSVGPTLRLNGVTLRGDPNSSIAEDAEAIAGEAGGLVFGVNQMGHMANNYVGSLPSGLDGLVGGYLADAFKLDPNGGLANAGRTLSSIAGLSSNALGLAIREHLTTPPPTPRPSARPWPDQVGRAFRPLWPH